MASGAPEKRSSTDSFAMIFSHLEKRRGGETPLFALGQSSIAFSLLEFICIVGSIGESCLLTAGQHQTLILQNFWVDEVHDDRLSARWGQLVSEFPLFVRSKLNQLGEIYGPDERITVGSFKKLRAALVDDLRRMGVTVIICTNLEISYDEVSEKQTFHITIKSGEVIEISEKKPCVINTMTKPMPEKLNLPIHTDLYQKPKENDVKKLIIFGFGLSAVWIVEQFPGREIKVISRKPKPYNQIARNEGTLDEKWIAENVLYSETEDGVIPVLASDVLKKKRANSNTIY